MTPDSIDIIENFVNNGDVCVIKFYADWCPHCKAIESDWKKYEKEFDNKILNGRKIHILDVADTQKSIHDEFYNKYNFKVSGFPTIIKISKENSTPIIDKFNGDRSYSGFKSFIN